jgi:alpha-1,4-galacturonosyltransferase
MVLNLAQWRAQRVTSVIERWTSFEEGLRTRTGNGMWTHGSQPVLLLAFHDDAEWLSSSWNVDGLGHRLNYPKEVLKPAQILHWTGPLKPWAHHGVNRLLWEPYSFYCPPYSYRIHTTTCRPDSWFC